MTETNFTDLCLLDAFFMQLLLDLLHLIEVTAVLRLVALHLPLQRLDVRRQPLLLLLKQL